MYFDLITTNMWISVGIASPLVIVALKLVRRKTPRRKRRLSFRLDYYDL